MCNGLRDLNIENLESNLDQNPLIYVSVLTMVYMCSVIYDHDHH